MLTEYPAADVALAHGFLPKLPVHAADHRLTQAVLILKEVLAVLPVHRAAATGRQKPGAALGGTVLPPEIDEAVLCDAQGRNARLVGHHVRADGLEGALVAGIFGIGDLMRVILNGQFRQNCVVPVAQEDPAGNNVGQIGVEIAGLVDTHRLAGTQFAGDAVLCLVVKLLAAVHGFPVVVAQKEGIKLLPVFVVADHAVKGSLRAELPLNTDGLPVVPQPQIKLLAPKDRLHGAAAHMEVDPVPVPFSVIGNRRLHIIKEAEDLPYRCVPILKIFRRVKKAQQQ